MSYQFNAEAADMISKLVKKNISIRGIYKELYTAKLFTKSEPTFRILFKSEFLQYTLKEQPKYKNENQISFFENIHGGTNNANEVTNSTINIPTNSFSDIDIGKLKFIDKVTQSNTTPSNDSNVRIVPQDNSTKNIEAILSKLIKLENKVDKLEKLTTGLVQENHKFKTFSKSLIHYLNDTINEPSD